MSRSAARHAPSRGAQGSAANGAAWQHAAGRSLAAYPWRRTLQTRVSDLDGYGHLNAVRLGQFYEEARASFHVAVGRPAGRVLVAQMTTRFLREGFWPDDVQVGSAIVRVGRSSLVMGQGLFQRDLCIGLAETVLVFTVDGRPVAVPQDYRSRLEPYRLLETTSVAATYGKDQ